MSRDTGFPQLNYMGASSFGSFAPVGGRLVDSCSGEPGRHYLAVEIGEQCQLACRHCIYHRPRSITPRPNAAILDEVAVTVHEDYRPIWITFAGKEPTVYPSQLVDIARRLRAPGTTSIVMTNGLLLKEPLIDDLSELIDVFDISLDGTRAAHDWMRGEGTYDRTWDRIEAVLRRTFSRVGVIATAVNGTTDDGRRQIDGVIDLAGEIVERCGKDGRVILATSLYYGSPGDPMLLNADDIGDLISGIAASGCPSRVLVTANYAHQWGEIARNLALDRTPVRYDAPTGLPVIAYGCVTIILFNLTQVPQVSARISNDGFVFLGCNHLTLGDAAADHAVADLSHERLHGVLTKLAAGRGPVFDALRETPAVCLDCPDLHNCESGDRLSGTYFNRGPVDPFCPRVLRGVHGSDLAVEAALAED